MKWGRVLTGVLTIALLLAGAWAQTKTMQKSGQKSTPSAVAKVSESTKSDASPSLAETVEWMKQTLEQYGHTEQVFFSAHGSNDLTACRAPVQNDIKLKSASPDLCAIEVEAITSALADCGMFIKGRTETTALINFRDLDPEKIKSQSNKARVLDRDGNYIEQDQFVLTLRTRGNAALIRTSVSRRSTPFMLPNADIPLATQDIAERFAKAMKHAVELCSEKKSLF